MVERVSDNSIRKLLRQVSLDRANALDALLDEVSPVWEIDRSSDLNLFQFERGTPNIIRIGLRCTVRLQAHAYCAGILIVAFGTPGFAAMELTRKNELLAPANEIFTWVVGLDVQRWWMERGVDVDLKDVLPGGLNAMPTELIGLLSTQQKQFGEALFRYASVFVLLHELGHLKHGDTESTHDNEKYADQFAAEWMLDSAICSDNAKFNRLAALYGIAVALLWLTIFNFYFGRKKSKTHPEGYDRLFQVLDRVIDPDDDDDEYQMVWYFVAQMLHIHMWSAGFDFDVDIDASHFQGDPRDEVNYLIDRIALWDRKR